MGIAALHPFLRSLNFGALVNSIKLAIGGGYRQVLMMLVQDLAKLAPRPVK